MKRTPSRFHLHLATLPIAVAMSLAFASGIADERKAPTKPAANTAPREFALRAGIPEVDDERRAIRALRARIVADRVYARALRTRCLDFAVEEEDPHYYDLVVREVHERGCTGDPNTSPVLDRFRLYRRSDTLLWFDVVNDRYLSYERFLRARRGLK